MLSGYALAILDQRSHRQMGIYQCRVFAADQRAEGRAQHSFQVSRLKDDAAQRMPQLINIHATGLYAIRLCSRITRI